jgi:hypothetical protein
MMEDDGGVQEYQQKGQWEQMQSGLKLLRKPFPDNHISKLPKPTKKQTEDVRADFKKGIRCQICGAWHHPDVIHLDYVGHAALTDRLLDADANWFWEPLAIGPNGLPVIDGDGGLWIKLTVCGVTRLGYGDAQGKTGGDAMKERIGDALRNAAMRFGAALDLWHKGDLHLEDDADKPRPAQPAAQTSAGGDALTVALMDNAQSVADLVEIMNNLSADDKKLYASKFNQRKAELS